MEQESIRDILDSFTIQVDSTEYEALVEFARFIKDRNYGEFSAVINTDPRSGRRDILINITNKRKIPLKVIQTVAAIKVQ